MKLLADLKFVKNLENYGIDKENVKNMQRRIKAYERELGLHNAIFSKKDCK